MVDHLPLNFREEFRKFSEVLSSRREYSLLKRLNDSGSAPGPCRLRPCNLEKKKKYLILF